MVRPYHPADKRGETGVFFDLVFTLKMETQIINISTLSMIHFYLIAIMDDVGFHTLIFVFSNGMSQLLLNLPMER